MLLSSALKRIARVPVCQMSLFPPSSPYVHRPDAATYGKNTNPIVIFDENDIADDDELEFDFTVDKSMPARSSQSWSESSPSHLTQTLQTRTTVRSLSTSAAVGPPAVEPAAPAQPRVKRQLPDWRDVDCKPRPSAKYTRTADELLFQVDVSKKAKKTTTGRRSRQNTSEVVIPKRIAKIFLSDEQRRVVDLVCNDRRSVFFTGSAGTGKSVLLREIIATLRKAFSQQPESVAVTASTGLAAFNIGGVTLHSFAGIGLGKEDVNDLVKRVKKNKKALQRWGKVQVLIIDEVSMVDGELFDKLEELARIVRNKSSPFGGIQLVITGDFFQLPPVPGYGKQAVFSFDAKSWQQAVPLTICLTQVFRQKDQEFADMLNQMRLGRLGDGAIAQFKQLSRELVFHDDIVATELFCTRREVDESNMKKMAVLPGKEYVFTALDSGVSSPEVRAKLLENCMAPEKVCLKKDCQVMLIKNMDESLVNGSLGIVVGFMSEGVYSLTRERMVEPVGRYGEQVTHEALMALETGFHDDEYGPEAKRLSERRAQKLKEAMSAHERAPKWPLVQFQLGDGTTRDVLVVNETWKVELPNGEIQAQRTQVPLILAWAMSIHKAQGQTLERVKVDLRRVFENGQSYVALSRATTKEGLQVLNFDISKVRAHPKVIEFYKSLRSVKDAGPSAEEEEAAYGM